MELTELCPQEATLELSTCAGKKYVLKRYTLRDRIWARNRFGDKLAEVLAGGDLIALSEIAHHLIKDKSDFQKFEDFAECISGTKDQNAVVEALRVTLGISEPDAPAPAPASEGNAAPNA
jgi:hypothetical protein